MPHVSIKLWPGRSEDAKRKMAEQALWCVGLANKAERLPNQISGGEQERVAIARAIVNDPPILLADEPTGNLDTKTSQEIMELLSRLNDGGMSIIMVTHSHQCAQYARRILKMADGCLVEGGLDPDVMSTGPAQRLTCIN